MITNMATLFLKKLFRFQLCKKIQDEKEHFLSIFPLPPRSKDSQYYCSYRHNSKWHAYFFIWIQQLPAASAVTRLRFGYFPLLRDECELERKACFIQEARNLGEGELMSETQLQRFCSTMKVFKGRIIWGRESESPLSSTVCRLSSDWLVVR